MEVRQNYPESRHKQAQLKWPLKVAGILLCIQGLYYLLLFPCWVTYKLGAFQTMDFLNWVEAIKQWSNTEFQLFSLWPIEFNLQIGSFNLTLQDPVMTSTIFSLFAIPYILIGISFLFRWRHARTIALLLQVFSLSIGLLLYYYHFHAYVYSIMFFGVILVFYLNHYEVRISFSSDSHGKG